MVTNEYLELKSMLINIINILELLIPSKPTVTLISNITGKSRQTVTAFLHNNYEFEVDYWTENTKITMTKSTALELLRKYNK